MDLLTPNRRKVPSLYAMSRFWLRVDEMRHHAGLAFLYESNAIDDGEPSCAACGWRVPTSVENDNADLKTIWRRASRWLDRAHLIDRSLGGSDRLANVIPLCHVCHREMPSFRIKADALAWVAARSQCPTWWQLVTEEDSPHTPRDRRELLSMWRWVSGKIARGEIAA